MLDPSINIELGTINLKQAIDRYGGQVEYALAAYNAGDTPVRQQLASNDYKDVPEFVESIPYTETREYVQAILRNRGSTAPSTQPDSGCPIHRGRVPHPSRHYRDGWDGYPRVVIPPTSCHSERSENSRICLGRCLFLLSS